jgi:hypothetical protein
MPLGVMRRPDPGPRKRKRSGGGAKRFAIKPSAMRARAVTNDLEMKDGFLQPKAPGQKSRCCRNQWKSGPSKNPGPTAPPPARAQDDLAGAYGGRRRRRPLSAVRLPRLLGPLRCRVQGDARLRVSSESPCYNKRSKVEAAIGRYKRVIGDALNSRHDARRATEVAIAVKSLNRMREFGQAKFVRVA